MSKAFCDSGEVKRYDIVTCRCSGEIQKTNYAQHKKYSYHKMLTERMGMC